MNKYTLILLFNIIFNLKIQILGASLICPSCDKVYCHPNEARQLKCPGSISKGVCGCCPVCSKTLGQKCGGYYNYLGSCDKGLTCVTKPLIGQPHIGNEGVCEKKSEPKLSLYNFLADQPVTTKCKPSCSYDYCSKNPKAICSAFGVVEEKKHCQNDCQHTSCKACRLVEYKEPFCPKCPKDDFHCMRKFGKCIKKWSCDGYYPCTNKYINNETIMNGKFLCLVPNCF